MTTISTSLTGQGPRWCFAHFLAVPVLVLLMSSPGFSQTGSSNWVKIGTDGKLQYTPDSKGNKIPDFSMVGYKNGDVAIPTVPVVKTLTALAGDNLSQIQAAINEVAALPLGGNGFRGAILLKAGQYNVSNTLNITASGIVLKGEGNTTSGTRIVATRTAQHTLINITGSGTPAEVSGSRTAITNSFVPVGAKSVNVASTAGLAVGNNVMLRIEPKQAWIDLIDMAQFGWTPSGYNMSYMRKITSISGSTVTLDAPVVDPIDVNLKAGYIFKFTWTHIENVGIENIRFSSVFSGTEDENHAWTAISIDRAQHCWVRNSNFYHFGYSAVHVKDWGVNVSVLNCQNLEPISITTGGRKYSFNLNGQLALFKDCYTHSGRHDYVTGSTTSGPSAFVNCKADNMRADIGPHHRWATGLLFDNVIGSGEQNVQNRGPSGSGHGWAGAQCLFWNCTSSRFRNQKPPQHLNWAIGCKGVVTDDGNWIDGNPGIWESTGNFIAGIQSLYTKQLSDRLSGSNTAPSVSITSPLNNATFNAPASVTINANASDSDGTITRVEFFNGATKLGEDTSSPYSFTWSNVGTGSYSLTARATDNDGAATTSSVVNITVQNPAPTASITSPANGATFTEPATVDITANASDANGTITKVEFFEGVNKLGEDLSAPFAFTWSNVSQGSYSLTAKATDNQGATGTSSAVSITVTSSGGPVVLTPVHDAYVRSGIHAGTTHGTTDAVNLITKVAPATQVDNHRETYLKFDLTSVSGTISAVQLRVFGRIEDATMTNIPMGVFSVANTTWTESTLTWNNKPVSGATALQSATVTDATARYYTWDVTNYVKSEVAAGRKVISLVMKSGIEHNPRTMWSSKETGSNPPQLSVTVTTVAPCDPVIASADDGNVAANVLDNDFNTRWSASGDPQWIQFCLASASSVSGVQIAFYKGNERTSNFDVLVSDDGTNFSPASMGRVSNGTSLALETFSFPAVNAKYVRIVGHGNSLNLWNSYTEVRINSTAISPPPEVSRESADGGIVSAYPVPADDKLIVHYEVKKAGKVSLSIYNSISNKMSAVVNGYVEAGTHEAVIDLKPFPSGMHILKLISDGRMSTQKILKK